MQTLPEPQTYKTPRHRVRELVCAYRPLRDSDGRVVDVPTVLLKDPRTAAVVFAPLIADQPVEVFAVACVSTKHRLLAWHVLSRGTRDSTPVVVSHANPLNVVHAFSRDLSTPFSD
jgi:hypothetical protein